MGNITFSAPDETIEKARQMAASKNHSLNEAFRSWLHEYANPGVTVAAFEAAMHELDGKIELSHMPNREERNAR